MCRIWKSWEYKNRPEFVISKGSQYCNYVRLMKKISGKSFFFFFPFIYTFIFVCSQTYIWQFGMDKDYNKVLTEELFLFKNGFIMCTTDFLVNLLKIFKPKQVIISSHYIYFLIKTGWPWFSVCGSSFCNSLYSVSIWIIKWVIKIKLFSTI